MKQNAGESTKRHKHTWKQNAKNERWQYCECGASRSKPAPWQYGYGQKKWNYHKES